jgi:hypothetical protein
MRATMIPPRFLSLLNQTPGCRGFYPPATLTDQIEILGGVAFYTSGNTPGFEKYADNDRLFFDVAYRF